MVANGYASPMSHPPIALPAPAIAAPERNVQTTLGQPRSWPLSVRRTIFLLGGAFCLTAWASPGVALALGMLLGLTQENPFQRVSQPTAKILLEISVVLLGFGMNLGVLLRAGLRGGGIAALTIMATFGLGVLLARWLHIPRRISTLISAGTAICGGSAIAAVSAVVNAGEAEVSVAMGTVFLLNAVALFLFPRLGHWMGLTPVQFGTWAGMAIHDISSVVGAASQFGLTALQTATAVKLSRALWIFPVCLVAGYVFKDAGVSADRKLHPRRSQWSLPPHAPALDDTPPVANKKAPIPWFVGLFLLASVLRSFVPLVTRVAPELSRLAETGLTLTLFLIGGGMTRKTLRAVGVRPLIQALSLWIVIASMSLLAVRMLPGL